MNSTQATARRAGVIYFLFMVVAIVREFLLPAFMVVGDAAATARNITAADLPYRLGVFTGFVTLVLFIFLIVTLYELFRNVDRWHAMLMVLLVSIGIAVSLANVLNECAPLILLSGADYLSVFSKPQLDALALGFLWLHGTGGTIAMAFWGLWLFPFGVLVIRSGFIPRILGILLMIAGFAYVATSVTNLALPAYSHLVSRVMTPLYIGEVPVVFWLLSKGARAPQSEARSSRSS